MAPALKVFLGCPDPPDIHADAARLEQLGAVRNCESSGHRSRGASGFAGRCPSRAETMNEHGGLTKRRSGADDQLMTLEEVGAYLQVPIKTLYDWRHKGCGPSGTQSFGHSPSGMPGPRAAVPERASGARKGPLT